MADLDPHVRATRIIAVAPITTLIVRVGFVVFSPRRDRWAEWAPKTPPRA